MLNKNLLIDWYGSKSCLIEVGGDWQGSQNKSGENLRWACAFYTRPLLCPIPMKHPRNTSSLAVSIAAACGPALHGLREGHGFPGVCASVTQLCLTLAFQVVQW